MALSLWPLRTDLRVDILLEVQLLLQGLNAVLRVHTTKHLILQLLLGIVEAALQLLERKSQEIRILGHSLTLLSIQNVRNFTKELSNLQCQNKVSVYTIHATVLSVNIFKTKGA